MMENLNVNLVDAAFTWAVVSVADISVKTSTGKASRSVGAVSVWTATSVIHSTLIHVCVTTHLECIIGCTGSRRPASMWRNNPPYLARPVTTRRTVNNWSRLHCFEIYFTHPRNGRKQFPYLCLGIGHNLQRACNIHSLCLYVEIRTRIS